MTGRYACSPAIGDRGSWSGGGGEKLTVNSTNDPDVPGGHYQTTTVYDADGNMPSGKGDNDRYV